ncbi:MAG: NAD(P)H-dependent glycerol-3-phosphate dehydrogenase [Fibrobacterota bacterium]
MKCTLLGAGSWGITLAIVLAENGHAVTLWEFDRAAFEQLVRDREEKDKLPGILIPANIILSNDLCAAVQGAEAVVLAVPTQFLRSVLKGLAKIDFTRRLVVNVAKGIEVGTTLRISEICAAENPTIGPANYVILSGPSHAEEVVQRMPTTIVAASSNSEAAAKAQVLFNTSTLRIYTNDDVVGVELAGALKNIIALAAGILDGLGFGDNTKGALMTRGMAEITRLGLAIGARRETFFGLSGIGDLITTCISRHSRNRHVGERIGRGESLESILKGMKMVAEGVATTRSAYELSMKYGIELPITGKIYQVLFHGMTPVNAVKSLMGRDLKPEGL